MRKKSTNAIHNILLSKVDYKALKDLINEYSASVDARIKKPILVAKEKLNKAKIYEPGDFRLADVVTTNSAVRFKNLSTKEDKEYLIVYPKLQCKELGRISILSDLGIALIGQRKGSTIEVKGLENQKYRVQIMDIQPTSLEWIKRLEEQC